MNWSPVKTPTAHGGDRRFRCPNGLDQADGVHLIERGDGGPGLTGPRLREPGAGAALVCSVGGPVRIAIAAAGCQEIPAARFGMHVSVHV